MTTLSAANQQKFDKLQQLGAGEFAHLNGSLETHLIGTYTLLTRWKATQELCDAGLFHAAYGTDGFDESLLGLEGRQQVADIIGQQAEQIVYLYCACSRQFVFTELSPNQPVRFRDRFTNAEFYLTQVQAQHFCELTVANELEIASHSPAFVAQHGDALRGLFLRMSPYLSQAATADVGRILEPAVEQLS